MGRKAMREANQIRKSLAARKRNLGIENHNLAERLTRADEEIERLREIETAARRFVQEADDYPRYAPVKVWATPEADPYLKLRVALGAVGQHTPEVK